MCLALFCLALGLSVTGCASSQGSPKPADPERASQAEVDVATDLWLRQNQPRQALEHVLKAVDLDEDNAEAQHVAALLYLDFCNRSANECQLDEAELHARAAVEARKDFREARNTLGVVLIHADRLEEAIDVLKPLTEDILYTTPENAWGNLGWAYLKKGALDPAIDALRRSVAAQPLFCVGHYRLGVALERKGKPEQALQALTRAVETDVPACRALQEAYATRASVAIKLGDQGQAMADLEHCVGLAAETKTGQECRSMLAKLK